jgi:hypothetical protein
MLARATEYECRQAHGPLLPGCIKTRALPMTREFQ